MQDRCQLDENLLQRTAGPYIWVNRVGLTGPWRLPLCHVNGHHQIGPALLKGATRTSGAAYERSHQA
jgi:hypothetical protein